MGSQKPQSVPAGMHGALAPKVQASLVASSIAPHKLHPDWFKSQDQERHTQKFADSSVGIDILKFYMEDDQLKLHQSHADRIDKTRREIQQKIREVRISKHGGSALTEVSALE